MNKYQSVQSSINAVTWNSFQITRDLMTDLEMNKATMETDEDLQAFHSQLNNLRMQIASLVRSNNNATFAKDSIDKDKFDILVVKLENLSLRMYSQNYEVSNKLRTELVELGKLLNKVRGGWGRSGILGSAKVIVNFDEDSYNETINKTEVILDILSNK